MGLDKGARLAIRGLDGRTKCECAIMRIMRIIRGPAPAAVHPLYQVKKRGAKESAREARCHQMTGWTWWCDCGASALNWSCFVLYSLSFSTCSQPRFIAHTTPRRRTTTSDKDKNNNGRRSLSLSSSFSTTNQHALLVALNSAHPPPSVPGVVRPATCTPASDGHGHQHALILDILDIHRRPHPIVTVFSLPSRPL